jgi:microcystin degradation protein MlrC
MKIIVASFQCEANSKAKLHPKKHDFEYFKGNDIFKKLVVKDVFEKNGFEVVPSIYAVALPSATVEKDVYDFYAEQILDTVRANPDAAGVKTALTVLRKQRMKLLVLLGGYMYTTKTATRRKLRRTA